MSAYTALISLKRTLYDIYGSCRLSIVSPSRQIIKDVYKELLPWKTILETLDETSKSKSRKKVNALDGRIKETLWNFEDRVESLLSHQIILQSSQGEREGDALRLFSIDLQSLQDDVDSFIHTLKFMKEEYIYEVDNMPQDEEEEPCLSTSGGGYGETNNSKMIGSSDLFNFLKYSLLATDNERDISHRLVGMGGIGKTRLAREIYEDPEIISYFDCRIWITVGRTSSARLINDLEVSRKILAELKGDEKCLIVVDDVWEATPELSSLMTSTREMENTIIHFLFTTRNASEIYFITPSIHESVVQFLNEKESKDLLCHKVFGENNTCPPQLDSAATKIANKCEGHPLTIVTVADILSKSENKDDPEYWEDVAEERNSVFTDAYTKISKVLYPTYEYLPQHLKMPLLYLGVFPPLYDIPRSKIMNMLIAEGWIVDTDKQQLYDMEGHVDAKLDVLLNCHNNIVLAKYRSIHWNRGRVFKIKSCRLHSSWRQLCRVEAKKNKFYHVLEKPSDASDQSIKGQRCLCLEYNFLFGFKEFCNSVRLDCASTTRSLLFFGPYHQYPTPIDAIGFKLLRELDALQLRFYSFPTQVLTLVQLKYLALTCNGQLPSTISKLFNLKVLIVHPHMSITKCCDTATSSLYIPIEIWDMKELEHIEILGKSFLPHPNDENDDVADSLEKIDTLVGVNANTICTITKRISNIRKLGVQMEVAPYDETDHSSHVILSCFPHISKLEYLKILKCSVINPVQGRSGSCSSSAPPRSLMMFPDGLKKLHLSGMGLPWEYMDTIGSLPNLKVLKLRSYAFRGSKWEMKSNSFFRLKYLTIEDSDLVEWIAGYECFHNLSYLSLKHCYKLQKLPWTSKSRFAKIELVDCNRLGVTCAKKLQREGDDGKFFVSASDDFEA